MVWYLALGSVQKLKIPKTHRYRPISHEAFREFAKYLEMYRLEGYEALYVKDCLSCFILKRLTGFDVRQDSSHDLCSGFSRVLYTRDQDFKKLMHELDPENGYVLVYRPKVYGMYIQYYYARVSNSEFTKLVETGVIEPKGSSTYGGRDITQMADAGWVSQWLSALKVWISGAKQLAFDVCHPERQSGAAGSYDG